VVATLYVAGWLFLPHSADELFAARFRREDVIALAFHVDYLGYIGWKRPVRVRLRTAETQRAYAITRGTQHLSITDPR